MEAIQTEYKGYKFRSRLEARWAVFFDSLGLQWFYEYEGYVLDNGEYYLPDFLLPDINTWFSDKNQKGIYVEVKPATESIDRKFERFASNSEIPVLLLQEIPYPYPDPGSDDFIIQSKKGTDFPYLFCECKTCGLIGVEYDGRQTRLRCKCPYTGRYNYDSRRLKKAYKNARSARFEHGEKPIA